MQRHQAFTSFTSTLTKKLLFVTSKQHLTVKMQTVNFSLFFSTQFDSSVLMKEDE